MQHRSVTVAAVDVQALVAEALDAIAAAPTPDELDAVRVRYLGRKSPLKQALRNVRDRESGMALNTTRERLESAVAERQALLERAQLERALADEFQARGEAAGARGDSLLVPPWLSAIP